jgi:O-acetylhomoserine/O-acetylserine sulfhydrylase-like pyridoxal-dependent enzyme
MQCRRSALPRSITEHGSWVLQGATYGGTSELVHQELAELGITHTVVDQAKSADWEAALTPQTKVENPHS